MRSPKLLTQGWSSLDALDSHFPASSRAQVVVHNCQMYPDLKRMLIKHQSFPATCAFSQSADNPTVYEAAAAGLVRWAARGGVAAMFMYGQTGSGKTHTMSSIEEMGSEQLFAELRQRDPEFARTQVGGRAGGCAHGERAKGSGRGALLDAGRTCTLPV